MAILHRRWRPPGGPLEAVTLAVDGADAGFARAVELGAARTVPLFDTDYALDGTIRGPQGAVITLSGTARRAVLTFEERPPVEAPVPCGYAVRALR